ncbi:hypothetical protein KBD81_02035 [Candidatus Woesebacteria bacterium]|nr:hypothetical protein [Candidatus Woesebacteria bacterium]
MGFSFPFFKKNKSQTVYFGLYITDASLCGFIFDTKTGSPEIISTNSSSLSAGFDKILEDTDNIISELELKSTLHLDKTIFFLHSWMIDEQTFEIKEPYKTIIKKLTKDLELTPMGYIDAQEALHEHLQKTSVLNTVAVEVNKTKLGVSVFKGGKKVYGQYTARTDTVGEDVQAVLEAIPGAIVLPSKIIVFGDLDTAEVSSELASFEWGEKVFTQHPTIEVLKQIDLNQALASTFTEEVVSQSKVPTPQASEPLVQPGEPLVETASEDFGFVIGQDIAEVKPQREEPLYHQEIIEETEILPVVPIEKKRPLAFLSRFSMKGASFKGPSKPILFGVIAAVILFLLLLAYEYFFHTMNVTMYLNSQPLDEQFDLSIPVEDQDTTGFAVVRKTTSQEFTDEKKTTGTREDGEKATGEVTIHNYTKEPRTFSRGTELKKGDLIFTLDAETKIASASGGTVDAPALDPGKTSAKVTAKAIGPEYNIAKGAELSVASLSDTFKAFAASAFTGGSKKDVKTVSKEDITELAKNVEVKADEGSAQVLGTSTSSDEVILPDSTKVSLAGTEYSGEVGEEASKLSVTATSEIEFLTIQKKVLHDKLAELLQEKLDAGYIVIPDSLEYEISDVTDDTDTVNVTVKAQGSASKQVDSEAVAAAAVFKSPSKLSDQIKSQFEVAKVDVTSSFSLSFWSPLFRKNITITTVSQ